MPISTDEMNRAGHEIWCRRLEVDDFKIDYFANVHPDEIKNMRESSWSIFGEKEVREREEHPPVIRWKRNGVWYSAVVPIKTRKEQWNCIFAGGEYDVVDWERMSKTAEKIIAEA